MSRKWWERLEKSEGGYDYDWWRKRKKNPNPFIRALETNTYLIRVLILIVFLLVLMGVLILTQTGIVGAVLRSGVC